MKIIKKEYVFYDLKFTTKKTILKEISAKALKLGLTDNANELYKAFLQREELSSTALENKFAIPHARSLAIKKPALFFVNLQKEVDWVSLDGLKTKYLFVILVPEENKNNIHIEILSTISTLLMDNDFINKIISTKNKALIAKMINEKIEAKINQSNNINKVNENNNQDQKFILAITACPVGVAHTYLAAEKLQQCAIQNNYQIKVETHGSVGIKNQFSSNDIDRADVVIIAADISIDLSRFNNKKVYKAKIKNAIHKPLEVINNAFANGTLHFNNSNNNLKANSEFSFSNEKTSIMKHIITGVSYMIPFVILGGICIAISTGLTKVIYGENSSPIAGDFLWYINKIGETSFSIMIGVLGAYIAYSIAGRAAIAPAFIVSMISNVADYMYPIAQIKVETPMGFLGSILFGLLIGYTVRWINSWNINKNISAIMPIFVIPLGVGLFYSLISIFVIGTPIGYVLSKFIELLKFTFSSGSDISIVAGIGFGILLGAMAGFDMGGPINKVAFITASTLITTNVYEPMGIMAAAIPVAPLGMGLCTFIFRKKFNENEKTLGVSSFIMGLIGISEGAIPFAISDPKKAIISNVTGSAVAGAIAGGFGVICTASHGGPIMGFLGAVSSNGFYGFAGGIGLFFVAIIIGSLITALMYGFLRKTNASEKLNFHLPFNLFKKKFSKDKVGNYDKKN